MDARQEIIDYAERYGEAALGHAFLDLVRNREFVPQYGLATDIWEYDGSTGIC